MTSRQWTRVKELFQAALDREPGDRPAFVERACRGDEATRAEVERLLGEHEAAGTFLEAPPLAGLSVSVLATPTRSGRMVGPYEVGTLIGSGGMGDVYRGTDTNLGRAVALKMLPEAFAQDAERLARFDREAKTLAALNHPHIAAIYGLERSHGQTMLVMELVDGPTLAEVIARGGVEPAAERLRSTSSDIEDSVRSTGAGTRHDSKGEPLQGIRIEEALPIARQIAEALETAHEQGIVHRDLKPANIKVKDDGTVKVLDFGLAKAMTPAGSSSNAPMSPTITTPSQMVQGVILGTAAYMSPEQARGIAVDRRTDIWAFGCVLYEMLTGRAAFKDEDVSMTLSHVLQRDPDFDALPAAVPARVRQVLRLCLNKDRRLRAGDMQDVRLALDGAFETASPATTAPDSTPPSRRLLVTGVAGLLAGALVTAGALWWPGRDEVASPARIERLSVLAPEHRPIAIPGFPTRSLALSPDGTALVYVALRPDAPIGQPRSGLTLRSLATLEVRDLPDTALALQPFFSPDGRWVAFFAEGSLKKVALDGGQSITLAEGAGALGSFGVWLDDGTIVFNGDSPFNLRRISADGGPVSELTTVDAAAGELGHVLPDQVPVGGAIVFSRLTSSYTSRIEALTLETHERRAVLDDALALGIIDGKYLLFQRQDALLRVPFDSRRLTITGPAVPVTEGVRPDSPRSQIPLAEVAMSRDGVLAYLPAGVGTDGTLGLVSRDGRFEPLRVPQGPIRWPRVSPDGRTVAFVNARGSASDVRVHDITRGATMRRGPEENIIGPAVWQPGTGALVMPGPTTLYLGAPGADGTPLVAVPPGALIKNTAWSPDGQDLVYTIQRGSQHDLWVLSPGAEPASRPLLDGPAIEYSPAFSPDGQWLAYQSDEGGRMEIYVQRYPAGERLPVSTAGGNAAAWSRDGREIFFIGQGRMMGVSVTPDGESLRLGTPVALFDLQVRDSEGQSAQYAAGSNGGVEFDVLPDGRFVMIRRPDQSTAREIVIVRHWID